MKTRKAVRTETAPAEVAPEVATDSLDHPITTILVEDGIEIPPGQTSTRFVTCWLHEDRGANMEVFVTDGYYYCHGCHQTGTALTYLKHQRGMDLQEMVRFLSTRFGWSKAQINEGIRRSAELANKKDKALAAAPERTETAEVPHKSHVVSVHDYSLPGSEKVACRVVYYRTLSPEERRKLAKKARLPPVRAFLTPAYRSGALEHWWLCDPMHTGLPDEDRVVEKYPVYGAMQARGALKEKSSRQIWVLPDERAVNAVRQMPLSQEDGDGLPSQVPPPVCLFPNATAAASDLDFLFGSNILIISEVSNTGRTLAKRLAAYLFGNRCNIRICLAPGEGKPGHLASLIYEKGFAGLGELTKAHAKPYSPQTEVEHQQDATSTDWKGSVEDNAFFKIIGQDANSASVVFQLKSSHQFRTVREMDLGRVECWITLADIAFWQAMAPDGNFTYQKFRYAVANELISAAREKGLVSMDNIKGRGAVRLAGSVYYHAGDCVLGPGTEFDPSSPLTRAISLTDASDIGIGHFTPRPKIHLHDDPQWREYAKEFISVVLDYRWPTRQHGKALIGWMVSSLIGGALPHRPAIWLQAASGRGKTTLIEKVMYPFFTPEVCQTLVDPTAAAIVSDMRSDSLPVVIDEFEADSSHWEGILNLMRQATGGVARRTRGSPSGNNISHSPRFSACFSSVDQPKVNDATRSRIVTIGLSHRRVDDWASVVKRIAEATKPAKMAAIRTAIIRNAGAIVEAVELAEQKVASKITDVEAREAQILGALSGCYGWLSGDPVDQWEMLERMDKIHDQTYPANQLLETLLAMPVRTSANSTLSLSECIVRGWETNTTSKLADRARLHLTDGDVLCREAALRHGFKFRLGDLLIAQSHPGVRELAKGSPLEKLDLDRKFAEIDGVHALLDDKGEKLRLQFAIGTRRCAWIIPRDMVFQVGLLFPESEQIAAGEE